MFPSGIRVCGRCRRALSIDEFAWRRKDRGERQPYCRGCMAEYNRAHYLANKELYVQRARRRASATLKERMAYLVDFFRSNPCVDCGEQDPLVLEFDHIGDKVFSIAEGVRDRGWQAFLDEIAKCEVVCANCHRRRTAIRGGFARAAAARKVD